MSDYAPGTRLKPIMINITVDEDLKIDHIGVGYHLQMPSGRVHDSGFTWYSPRGNYAQAPSDEVSRFQGCVDILLRAAATHEGVELPVRGG